MVQGMANFERRWTAIPRKVRQAAIETLEQNAEEIVTDMNKGKPLAEIEIGWNWGKAPANAMTLGTVGNSDRGLFISIWARSTQGSGFDARWFEYGTAPRFQKSGRYTGQIQASPFFWPVWRARRKRLKSRLTRNVNKAIKEG